MKHIQRFLWFLAGFDSATLWTDECRSVRSKYSSIGGLVLMTAVLAACSGGYAIHSVFDSWWTAAPFALLWASFILWLDRYLITSTRKLALIRDFYTTLEGSPPFAERKRLSSLMGLFVRLLLAALIGFVVAKPIEMRLLKPWVQQQNADFNTAERDRLFAEIRTMEAGIATERQRLDAKAAEVAKLTDDLVKELTNPIRPGDGRIAAGIRANLNRALADQSTSNAVVNDLVSRRDARRLEIEKELDAGRVSRDTAASIISDLSAVRDIVASGGKRATLVATVSWLLTCLFVVIEIAPILSKAISPFDVYDAMLAQREHGVILRALVSGRDAHEKAVTAERGR